MIRREVFGVKPFALHDGHRQRVADGERDGRRGRRANFTGRLPGQPRVEHHVGVSRQRRIRISDNGDDGNFALFRAGSSAMISSVSAELLSAITQSPRVITRDRRAARPTGAEKRRPCRSRSCVGDFVGVMPDLPTPMTTLCFHIRAAFNGLLDRF